MRMRVLAIHHCQPTRRHIDLVAEYGDDSLDAKLVDGFYANSPDMPGFERAEPGCLLRMVGCVTPHVDGWIADDAKRKTPRKQRSLFWLIKGDSVNFKVDGFGYCRMAPGTWVVFDHRREHMVLADGEWMGAAWQLRPVMRRKAAVNAAYAEARKETP